MKREIDGRLRGREEERKKNDFRSGTNANETFLRSGIYCLNCQDLAKLDRGDLSHLTSSQPIQTLPGDSERGKNAYSRIAYGYACARFSAQFEQTEA